MSNGWIKLHRKLFENPLSKDPEFLSVWIYLLTHANHKENKLLIGNNMVNIKQGELITSRQSISKITGVHESKVERILKCLKIEQMIEQQNLFRCRLITITNWEKYQISEQQNEHYLNSRRTVEEQLMNTNNNIKNDNKKDINTLTPDKQSSYKNGKIKKPSDPRVKEFIDYFFIAYQEQFKIKYHVVGGKDGMIIKRLLGTFDLPKLKELCDNFLKSEDEFLKKAGYTIGIFESTINKIGQKKQNDNKELTLQEQLDKYYPNIIPEEEIP